MVLALGRIVYEGGDGPFSLGSTTLITWRSETVVAAAPTQEQFALKPRTEFPRGHWKPG
jgi:hypothetical protein